MNNGVFFVLLSFFWVPYLRSDQKFVALTTQAWSTQLSKAP